MVDGYTGLWYVEGGDIAVKTAAIKRGIATPMVFFVEGDKVYSLSGEFDTHGFEVEMPTFKGKAGGARALRPGDKRDAIVYARQFAKSQYEQLVRGEQAPEPVPAPEPKPEPVPTPTPAPEPKQERKPMGAVEALLVDALADIATDTVIERIAPDIERLVAEQIAARIPRPVTYNIGDKPLGTVDGVTHEEFDKIVYLLSRGENVYIYGPAGTGKTSMLVQIGEALESKTLLQSKISDVFELTGFITANGSYMPTAFYKAWTEGYVLMWDEFDRSNDNAVDWTNAALSVGVATFPDSPEPVAKHPNFRLIANGNTNLTGADNMYTSAVRQDASVKDRFVELEVGYSERIEAALTADHELLSFVRSFREACAAASVEHVVSYRAITRLDGMARDGFMPLGGANGVLQSVLTRHLTGDDIRIIRGRMSLSTGKYADALATLAA